MEVKLNLSKKDLPKIMRLAIAGCTELLNIPELCSLVNKDWEDRNYQQDDALWYLGATPVHALAFYGYSEVLNYPQYLKIKNERGKTPLHYLAQSFIPKFRYSRNKEPFILDSKITKVLDKILEVEGLGDLKAEYDVTPLHFIGELGYVHLLNYPGVESIESPHWNSGGTPMTLLYYYASDNLERLLKHPEVMTEYKGHDSPLHHLGYNTHLRPTVKKLQKYKFKMNKKWHPSKKLDKNIVADIMSVNQSIRFMIYN